MGLSWALSLRFLVLSAVAAFGLSASSGNDPSCADRLAVAQLDLSALTAIKMQGWALGMRSALLDRLDAEILEIDFRTENPSNRRAARLLDLYLLVLADTGVAKESFPGLEKLGVRRLNSGPAARNQDFSEEESPSGSVYPITASTYYVQVENEIGYRILTKWMNAGALTARFRAWGIYKTRFQFPSIQGFGGPHLVDWVPCFHGANHHPGIITNFRGAGQQWERNLMPNGPSHAALEKFSPEILREPYSDLALRKLESLGWRAAASVLSKLDPSYSLTLLKMAGYEAEPFRKDELFWVNNPSRSTRIAARVLGALKVMYSLHASLMPAGTIPETSVTSMKEQFRELDKKDALSMNELMADVLSFSGAVSTKQRREQYEDTQPAYFYQIDKLNRKFRFIESDLDRILKEHSLDKENRSYWKQVGWVEYDLLRTLDFMASRGMAFDEDSGEWIRR